MSTELDTTIPAGEDPTADSLEAPDDDSAANSPEVTEPVVDWEARYKATQADLTKSKQALAAFGALQREQPRQRTPEPTEDELAALPPHLRREVEEARTVRQQMEWQQVRAQYGDTFVDGYEQAFFPAYQRDPARPAAMMDGLVAFIGYLAEHAKDADPQAKRARSKAVEPRVETNKPDALDNAELDKQIEAAKAGKGKDPLLAGIIAIRKKAGFEY